MAQSCIESDDNFAEFFNHSVDLMCIAGLHDGYFKRLNPAWTTRLGWSVQQLLGKPFIDFVHPDDRERTLAEVAGLSQGKVAVFFENRYRHLDGSYRWLQWNARPQLGKQRIYAAARDMTQRMQLERHVLKAIDQERERLGRDMHDGHCQTLAGIAALSAALSSKLAASGSSVLGAHAGEINKLLKRAITEARDMARGLDPISMDEGGLRGALNSLAINVQQLFPVSCISECHHEFAKHNREVEIQLFRIAQEAVNNAVAHARADRIVIGLSCANREGVLTIKDDGVGMPREASLEKGMGSRTMAYRARLINGFLELRRRKECGSVVTCTFPLPSETLNS